MLGEALSSDQAENEKGDYFMTKVTVMSVRRENPAYMACPSMEGARTCNKKVIHFPVSITPSNRFCVICSVWSFGPFKDLICGWPHYQFLGSGSRKWNVPMRKV